MRLVFSALITAALLLPTRSVSETWIIQPDGGGSAPTIQAGIDSAAVGDTVRALCGTYFEHDIVIANGVLLTSDTGLPDCVTIDAQQQGRVFHGVALDSTTTIRGFTITGGLSQLSDPIEFVGGGMLTQDGSGLSPFTIQDCVFLGNSATQNGGGLACMFGSSPKILRCTFEGNDAGSEGGGLYCFDSSPSVEECQFIGNTADVGGGALGTDFTDPTFTGCSFVGNMAVGAGHADGGGGAAIVGSAMGQFDNCDFTGNSAPRGGGVHFRNSGEVTLLGCYIAGNTATSFGGGVFVEDGEVVLDSCTVVSNLASSEGGALAGFGFISTDINNTTIASNSAPKGGGASVHNRCRFNNSVIWGNCATQASAVWINPEFRRGWATFSCCVVDSSQSSVTGGGTEDWIGVNHSADPWFCNPLDCASSPTTGGDYTVQPASPCLPANSGGCGAIGAHGLGSCPVSVRPLSWGAIKTRYR